MRVFVFKKQAESLLFFAIKMLKLLFLFSVLFSYIHTVCAQEHWQAGDLIFRRGTEPVSDMVMMADSQQTAYSHVGMLVGEPGHWEVVHATPQEVEGRGDAVVVDDLTFFISPERSLQYTVFHVNAGKSEREKAVDLALKRVGEPFFVDNGEGLYCTTLVWWAWRDAGIDLQVTFMEVTLPLMQGHYLMPSGLLSSPLLSEMQVDSQQ